MSYLVAVPDSLTAAASDLAGIGAAISDATTAADAATRGMLPAAADEVSAQIAEFFAGHADQYRAVTAQAAAFHSAFVRALDAGEASYASAEAANVLRCNRSRPMRVERISRSSWAEPSTRNRHPVTSLRSTACSSNPTPTTPATARFGLYTPESAGLATPRQRT